MSDDVGGGKDTAATSVPDPFPRPSDWIPWSASAAVTSSMKGKLGSQAAAVSAAAESRCGNMKAWPRDSATTLSGSAYSEGGSSRSQLLPAKSWGIWRRLNAWTQSGRVSRYHLLVVKEPEALYQ